MPRPTIIFSHANSFPASTYRVLFAELERRGWRVKAVEKFGHDERYPVSNNWPQLVQQLRDFAAPLVQASGAPAFLVGHSLGGFLSIMAAARNPELACGVLLLDAPLIGGWKATSLGVAKTMPLLGALSPGAVSRKRRNAWPDAAQALAHFQSKKVFASWDAQVLRDYVTHGLHEQDGRHVLSFRREVETAIYNTLPDNLERLLKRHPLKCPAAFIGGLQSEEVRRVGLTLTEKITQGRIFRVDGSHLFPMEQPLTTAAAIEAALLNLGHARQLKSRSAG